MYMNPKAFQGEKVLLVFNHNLLRRLNHFTQFQFFCGARVSHSSHSPGCINMHDALLALRTKRSILRRSLEWDSEDRTKLQPFTSAGSCPFWHLGTCSFVHCIFHRKTHAETTTPITPRALGPSVRILRRGRSAIGYLAGRRPTFPSPATPMIGRLPRFSSEEATSE